MDLINYNKGIAMCWAVGEVETLTDCPLVTLSRTDQGLTLSIYPVCIGPSLLVPKLICDEGRGVTRYPFFREKSEYLFG